MTRLDELRRAVLAQPASDDVRLVYADALLEAGDVSGRAELIVRQCSGDPAETLAASLVPVWEALLGQGVRILRIERGFPSMIDLTLAVDDGLAALDHAPIDHLRLRHDHPDAGDPERAVAEAIAFTRDPARTGRLRILDLTHAVWGPRALATLGSASLPALRELAIGDEDCAAEPSLELAWALAANRSLALSTLELHGDSCGVASDCVRVVCRTPSMSSLRTLHLENCSLDAGDMVELATTPHLEGLTCLELDGGSNTTNVLGEDGLGALARSPHLTRLRRLSVAGCELERELAALADPVALPALSALVLDNTQISEGVLTALVAARPVEELHLGNCHRLGDDAAAAIARSPHASRLRVLRLHGTRIGPRGIATLIDSEIGPLDLLQVPATADELLHERLIRRFGGGVVVG